MVERFIRSLTAPVRGLHEAAYVLAALTFAAQLLALLRDRLFAHVFGASATLDLYYAAFKLPDLIFALVASLVSAYVLIPRITVAKHEEAKRLISETTTFLLIGAGVLALVVSAWAPQLLTLLFPNIMQSALADNFVLLSRILLLQPILLGLSSIMQSVTQVRRRFFLFALSPVLYNIGIIGGIFFLYPRFGVVGVGIGVLVGAVLHLGVQVPTILREGLFPHPTIPRLRELWSIMRDSIPRSLALGMGSFVALALAAIAARQVEGSVSIFTLASNLEGVPLALIGASYATAAFPALSEHAGKNDPEAFSGTLTTAARHIIFWSSVITVITIVLRAHIVRTVLGTGAFGWEATRLTSAVLAVLVAGLVAQGIILLASRAFYAMHRSWNPLLIQLVGAVVTIGSAFGFLSLGEQIPMVRYFIEELFRVADVPGTSILMIAVGATLGQVLMGIFALGTLGSVAPRVAKSLVRPLSEGFAAAILGGAAAYGVLALLGNIAPLTTLLAVFTEGALAGIVGLTVAAGGLALLENKEFHDLAKALRGITTRKLPPQSEF